MQEDRGAGEISEQALKPIQKGLDSGMDLCSETVLTVGV